MRNTAYISKEIAARTLNVSPRRVLELSAEGKIRRREDYNPQTKRRCTIVSAEDVARLAAERTSLSDLVPAAAPPQVASAASSNGALQRVAELVAETQCDIAPPHPSAPPRPWMTLTEASAYSGLSVRLLHSLIRRGVLPALADEPVRMPEAKRAKPGACWRIKRADLDALCGVRQVQTGLVAAP